MPASPSDNSRNMSELSKLHEKLSFQEKLKEEEENESIFKHFNVDSIRESMKIREQKQLQVALIRSQQNAKNANKFMKRNQKYFLLFAIDEVDDINISPDCDDATHEFVPIMGRRD